MCFEIEAIRILFLYHIYSIVGWDGIGWNGAGWDGIGWDGAGWDGSLINQKIISRISKILHYNYEAQDTHVHLYEY